MFESAHLDNFFAISLRVNVLQIRKSQSKESQKREDSSGISPVIGNKRLMLLDTSLFNCAAGERRPGIATLQEESDFTMFSTEYKEKDMLLLFSVFVSKLLKFSELKSS